MSGPACSITGLHNNHNNKNNNAHAGHCLAYRASPARYYRDIYIKKIDCWWRARGLRFIYAAAAASWLNIVRVSQLDGASLTEVKWGEIPEKIISMVHL